MNVNSLLAVLKDLAGRQRQDGVKVEPKPELQELLSDVSRLARQHLDPEQGAVIIELTESLLDRLQRADPQRGR